MSAPIFVDTNVLVYRFDSREPIKQRAAEAWIEGLWHTRRGRLSFQVLQEFYVTVTHKLSPGMPSEDARRISRALMAWNPVSVDARVLDGAWAIQDRYGLSWWDSLIVAAARVADCSYLLTEDLQHGQQLGSLQVVSPFEMDVSSLLPA